MPYFTNHNRIGSNVWMRNITVAAAQPMMRTIDIPGVSRHPLSMEAGLVIQPRDLRFVLPLTGEIAVRFKAGSGRLRRPLSQSSIRHSAQHVFRTLIDRPLRAVTSSTGSPIGFGQSNYRGSAC
jgi:hypothetical protein